MLVAQWLFGDLFKLSYYSATGSPTALVMSAFFSCCVDCLLFSQFWLYRQRSNDIQAKLNAQTRIIHESDLVQPQQHDLLT